MKPLNVLVACERSGVVREAFRKLGHYASSCDLAPAEDGSKHHFQCSIWDLLGDKKSDFTTWDLLIAHPPCTYLCNSGVRWLYANGQRYYRHKTAHGIMTRVGNYRVGNHNPGRWLDMRDAAHFFLALQGADIPHIALENPIMHKHAMKLISSKQDQIIQPYHFGHMETKATCLWLKNLPKLVPTNDVKQQTMRLPKAQRSRIHYASPGPNRAVLRSRTYQGIADAMAKQWSEYITK